MRQTILLGLEQAYHNLVGMISDFLPRLVVMLIIIAIGLLIALVLKYVLRGVLGLTKIDRVSEEAGASRILRIAHLPSMSILLDRSVFWITWFGFVLVGLSVLNVAGLQGQIARLFQFLPEVFIGILILFLGLMTANFLSRAVLLASVNAGFPSPRILSWSVRFVILILAIAMTLDELGVARQTVISAFSILLGAVMLGLAIAFGLGGQELARKSLEKYLGNSKKENGKEPLPL
jgi:small-conductance mechanosensitive channel